MAREYLIVSQKILPDYLEKVIEARELLSSHEVKTVTEAVRKTGISRNTYYKYKDYVFLPEEKQNERKAVVSIILKDEPGALSLVLSSLTDMNASVITISQSIPVAGKAAVLIAVNIGSLRCSVDDMIHSLRRLRLVTTAHLDSVE